MFCKLSQNSAFALKYRATHRAVSAVIRRRSWTISPIRLALSIRYHGHQDSDRLGMRAISWNVRNVHHVHPFLSSKLLFSTHHTENIEFMMVGHRLPGQAPGSLYH